MFSPRRVGHQARSGPPSQNPQSVSRASARRRSRDPITTSRFMHCFGDAMLLPWTTLVPSGEKSNAVPLSGNSPPAMNKSRRQGAALERTHRLARGGDGRRRGGRQSLARFVRGSGLVGKFSGRSGQRQSPPVRPRAGHDKCRPGATPRQRPPAGLGCLLGDSGVFGRTALQSPLAASRCLARWRSALKALTFWAESAKRRHVSTVPRTSVWKCHECLRPQSVAALCEARI